MQNVRRVGLWHTFAVDIQNPSVIVNQECMVHVHVSYTPHWYCCFLQVLPKVSLQHWKGGGEGGQKNVQQNGFVRKNGTYNCQELRKAPHVPC